jgi:peptidoglycan hydrolase-like protein with peptidoglycan-binding domain
MVAALVFMTFPFSSALASVSISIQSLSPSNTISVGTPISFSVVGSGFSNPSYTLSDSFSGGTISSSLINSSGNFSWTPTSNDVGTHTLTITMNDSAGDTATTIETINVTSATGVSIQSLSPGSTIDVGQNVSFNVSPSGFSNPSYTLSDSFGSNGTVSTGDINSSGNFSWTPQNQDVGTHNITVTVSDGSGHSASVSETITVNSANTTVTGSNGASISIQSMNPAGIVNVGSSISFYVEPSGFTSPTYVLSDSFPDSTLSSSNINSSGYVLWTPSTIDAGTHSVTIGVQDSYGHAANISLSLAVTNNSVTSSGVAPEVYPTTGTVSTTPCLPGDIYNTSTGALCSNTTSVTTSSAAVSTVPETTFVSELVPGSTGDEVTALQNLLTAQGMYSGPVTGYYGDLTEAAVENLQTAHGLSAVGVVGPATRALLNQLQTGTTVSTSATTSTTTSASTASDGYKFNNPLDVGSTGQDVTELQQRLTVEGVYNGPVTGYYGSLTQTAVEAYQSAHGLDPLGNVGPGTRSALNSGE